ncbi:hypothetical protein GCM10027073_11810 [Streptomyces chlorus]
MPQSVFTGSLPSQAVPWQRSGAGVVPVAVPVPVSAPVVGGVRAASGARSDGRRRAAAVTPSAVTAGTAG